MPFHRRGHAVLLALALALFAAAPAAAADRARLYEIDGVRDVLDRTAIATRGAAIVEADHGHVVAGMTKREVRAVRTLGYRVQRLRAPRRPSSGPRARTSDSPSADCAFHNCSETVSQITNVANAYPAIVQRVALGTPSYQGRTIYALKVSDNVAADEA